MTLVRTSVQAAGSPGAAVKISGAGAETGSGGVSSATEGSGGGGGGSGSGGTGSVDSTATGGGSGGGSDSGSGGGFKGGMPDTGDRSLPTAALAAMAGIGALAVAGGAALYRRRR